jgi:transposase
MARTYSQDLRDRVLAAYDRGMKTKQIAETFNVSPAWARRVKQCRRETGRTTPLPRGGARVIKIDMQRLAELVREQPDATLRELAERLEVQCSESAVSLALKRQGLTFKKRRSMRPSRIAPMWPNGVARGRTNNRSAMRSG